MPSRIEPSSRIGLGTVQFGLDYGITNRAGRVSAEEAGAILALASARGIDTIDTARTYGDAERVVSDRWPSGACFRIVTKPGEFSRATDGPSAVALLRSNFERSLATLGRADVHGLLVHHTGDLLGPFGSDLWDAMEDLKASGCVSRIGASVYDPEQIDRILDLYPIDIVQLPFNALDRRLVDGGQLERLARVGVEIHARSVFLQGVLLNEDLPAGLEPLRAPIGQLDRAFAELGLSRLEGVLAAALARTEISRFIVGVTSAAELGAILDAEEKIGGMALQLPASSEIDPRYLSPARWTEIGS
jgi:aryl-alcohol dehydrogenase-like predicted oxidoreductase